MLRSRSEPVTKKNEVPWNVSAEVTRPDLEPTKEQLVDGLIRDKALLQSANKDFENRIVHLTTQNEVLTDRNLQLTAEMQVLSSDNSRMAEENQKLRDEVELLRRELNMVGLRTS
jgi:hypothetical protein